MISPWPIAVYADGGVVGSSRSTIGGTWSFCHVDENNQRVLERFGTIETDEHCPDITNNLTEFVALTLALEALPRDWNGTVFSDSNVTLGRFFRGWKVKVGIPEEWQLRAKLALLRIRPSGFVLLDGHPTRAQLVSGRGKRGSPVSEHNVWCDWACNKAKDYFMNGYLQ